MNLIILVLTIYMHATTSLETRCLPFQNNIFKKGGSSQAASLLSGLQQFLDVTFSSHLNFRWKTDLPCHATPENLINAALLCSFWAAFRRQRERIFLFLDVAELHKGLLFCNLFPRSDACVSKTPSREEVWRSHPTWLWEKALQRCVWDVDLDHRSGVLCQNTFRRE